MIHVMSRKLASDLGCSNVLTFMLLTCSAYIKTCSARLRGFNFTLYLYSSPCFDVVLVGGWWVVGPEGLLQAWSGLGTRDQGACTSTVQVRLQVQYCTRSPARQSPVRFCAVQVRSTVPVQVQVQYVIIMRKRTVYLYKLCATALVTGQ